MINQEEWIWIGLPGHFVGGMDCKFHLCTVIGNVMVSTVGDYRPSGERLEIGWNRYYETAAFQITGWEDGYPTFNDDPELIMYPANTPLKARANHMGACLDFAKAGVS